MKALAFETNSYQHYLRQGLKLELEQNKPFCILGLFLGCCWLRFWVSLLGFGEGCSGLLGAFSV
jgi:hypothetical protein